MRLRIYIAMCISVISIVFSARGIMSFAGSSAEVVHSANSLKYYEIVEVKSGDTLYELARPFYDSRFYSSYDSYLDEVRYMNRMISDTIYPGRIISVPCYLK